MLSLKLREDDLVVEVGGPVAPPLARSLATAVVAARGRPTKVTVRWTPRQEFAASSDATSLTSDAALRARQIVDSWVGAHPEVAVLGVTVPRGVARVDLAAETTPADVDTLVAALRAQAGMATEVRLASLRRLNTGS